MKKIHFRTMARPDGRFHLQILNNGWFSQLWETVDYPFYLTERKDIDHHPSSNGSIFGTVQDCIKYVYFQQNEKPEKLILIEHPSLLIHPVAKPTP